MDTVINTMHNPIAPPLVPHLPPCHMLSLEEALSSLELMPHHPPSIENLTFILLKCRKHKIPAYALRLHACLRNCGLEAHKSLGNYLVPMLAEVGRMCDAQQVFDRLVDRNEHSWTSLIAGYIECGQLQHAFILYQKMQEDSVHPSAHTFVALLKACAKLKDAERGREIHAEIASKGFLGRYLFVGNALVDMYTKSGSLANAQEVFDNLPVRDAVSWNALIAGYAEHVLHQEALHCFEQMQLEGISPDAITCVCSLKACGNIGAIDKGQEIHAHIVRKGLLERNLFVGNALVDMYAKCGLLAKAREVFDQLPVRDEVSWTALIAGYAEYGFGQEALDCFKQMQLEGTSCDAVTFVCSLKACGSIGAIERGLEIHTQIARKGLLKTNLFVGNALVDMYTKCGSLAKAQEVFDKLPVRDEVSWTAIITGHAEHQFGEEALICFEQMKLEGISPNEVTFVCILKVCGSVGAIEKGAEVHADIATKGLLEIDPFVGNALVDMYAKCGLLAKAQEMFDELPVRDAVSWTALIAGLAEHGLGQETLDCFDQMQLEGISPNVVPFVCSLKACGNLRAIEKGIEIHVEIARKGLLERETIVGNALVDMYAKCGSLATALETFNKLPIRDAVSWNAVVAGYALQGLSQEGLNCFEQMQLEGISPDVITFVCSLKACGSIGAIDKGREIHAQISSTELLEKNLFLGSTLLDMYAKCGLLAKAQEVFDKLPIRDAVSWTALIAGYAEHGLGQVALNCFEQMQLEGVSPDVLTFVCSLKACGNIGAIDKGIEIHAELDNKGLLERDPFVGSTLVDMYAKCGLLSKAHEVFDKLPVRDAVSWTALIAGYTNLGDSKNVFLMLDRMRAEDIKPDALTFLNILTVCSHAGLVNNGQTYFEAMSKDYGITPTIEHHTCMVDLLGRAGQLDKAVLMIKKMPFNPNIALWHTILGACQKWGNVELGRWAFEHAVQLDEKDAAAYVLMSNIYADAHMQEDGKHVEAMRLKEQAWKKPGQSWWTDSGRIVHSFLVGDTGHSQVNYIYAEPSHLSCKMREEGYAPGLHWLSKDISNDVKEAGVCGHNEKLVIARAPISTPKGTPKHMEKNIQVCKDCHLTTALISNVKERTIIVKDANQFHVFKNGKCACGDY